MFRALLESAPDAVVIAGADGRIVPVNERADEMFGYPRADPVGQPVELLPPEPLRVAYAGHRASDDMRPARRPMGTGLGLASVQDMIEKAGGEVRLDSAVGVGTTVTLPLPEATTGHPSP